MSDETQDLNLTTSGFVTPESDPETGKKNVSVIDAQPVPATVYPSSVYIPEPPATTEAPPAPKKYYYKKKQFKTKIQDPQVVKKILLLAAEGKTGAEIAETIGVGTETWRKYTKVLAKDHGLEFPKGPRKHGNRYTGKSVTKSSAAPAPVVTNKTHTGRLVGDMTVNEILSMAEALKTLTGGK